MPLRDNLKLDEIRDLYGHSFTKNKIKTVYPYDDRVFCKEKYKDKKYTVTYDPYAAMTMRRNHIPVIVWGQKYKNHRAFVFQKERPRAIQF